MSMNQKSEVSMEFDNLYPSRCDAPMCEMVCTDNPAEWIYLVHEKIWLCPNHVKEYCTIHDLDEDFEEGID